MSGVHESEFKKNKSRLLKLAESCAICGAPLDKSISFPHPMSPSIDHIIAVANGGHPSSMDNLQVVHLICNQVKGTKDTVEKNKNLLQKETTVSNRALPQSCDWVNYRGRKA